MAEDCCHIIAGMSDIAAVLFMGGIVAFFVVFTVVAFLWDSWSSDRVLKNTP